MKKLFILLSVVFIFVVSCDKIEPFKDGTYRTVPEVEIGGDTLESVILFEFTGWACVFCPNGHDMIHAIEAAYPDRVYSIAIHAGGFAEPGDEGPDFRCQESDDLLSRFDDNDKFPGGAINSMNLADVNSPDAWSVDVATAFEESKNNSQAYITINEVITETIVTAHIKVEFIQNLTGDYNLSLYVVENGIVAPQKHFSEGLIEEYHHSHALRGSMNNGIIGDLAGTDPFTGTIFEKSFSFIVDSEWVADSLHVIPFIYNVETNIVIPTKIIKLKSDHWTCYGSDI